LNSGVVVAEDLLESLSGACETVGSVLAQTDAVAPSSAEKSHDPLTVWGGTQVHAKQGLGKLQGPPHVEPGPFFLRA